jgi:DNA-binding LacI/PurR family transcriptional regulator
MADVGRPRLVDVAEAAGVSVAAASVALNGRAGVSDDTRTRIQKAARRLGYIPDMAAASLRNGRSGLVAFIGDAVDHPVVAGISARAVDIGLLLVLALPAAVPFLEARNVDAAFVARSDKAATAWAKLGRPLVVVGPGRLPRGATRLADDAGDDALDAVFASLFG